MREIAREERKQRLELLEMFNGCCSVHSAGTPGGQRREDVRLWCEADACIENDRFPQNERHLAHAAFSAVFLKERMSGNLLSENWRAHHGGLKNRPRPRRNGDRPAKLCVEDIEAARAMLAVSTIAAAEIANAWGKPDNLYGYLHTRGGRWQGNISDAHPQSAPLALSNRQTATDGQSTSSAGERLM